MNAPAFAARAAADPCLVDFDVLVRAAADAVPVGANHSSAQLVKELKGGLVTREAQLPLELHRGYAGSLAGDQIGCPKPDGQRRAAALHDRADSQSCLASAFPACQHARSARNAERFTAGLAARADEAALPARLFEIRGTSRVIREKLLKLRQRPRKWQRRALLHVHHDGGFRSHFPSGLGAGRSQKGDRQLAAASPAPFTTSKSSGCMCQPDRHGLKVECALDTRIYEKEIKVSDAEMAALNITGDDFHPEWNYTINPRRSGSW